MGDFVAEACSAMIISILLYHGIKSLVAFNKMNQGEEFDWAEVISAGEQGRIQSILRVLEKDPDLIYTTDATGETILHVVARAGNARSVSKIMEFVGKSGLKGVLLKQNINGDTALHVAVKNRHLDAAYWLVEVESKAAFLENKDGVRPWDLAREAGYRKLLSHIPTLELQSGFSDIEMMLIWENLTKAPKVTWIKRIPKGLRESFRQSCYDINPKQIQLTLDKFGGNILHIAAHLGRVDLLRLVVSFMSSSELTNLAFEKNFKDETALHLAIKGEHEMAARYLIEVAPETAYVPNKKGISPLYLAIESGYQDLVEHIFQHSPGSAMDSSTRNSLLNAKKVSIVHAAVRARNLGMLKRVTEELPGCIDSSNEQGWKPLSYAAYRGYLDEVSYFLNNFPDSVSKSDRDGSFPIHKVVCAGHVQIVEEFLSFCPSAIHLVDKKGQSILHFAVKYARADVFSYLTRTKKNVVEKIFHLKDYKGRTFIDLAKELEITRLE